MKAQKILALVLALVLIFSLSSATFAAETSTNSAAVSVDLINSETPVSPQLAAREIPYYYYVVIYKDGSVYKSAVVYRTVTVPAGKTLCLGDPELVSTTNTYNGVEVKIAGRYEYPYWFE